MQNPDAMQEILDNKRGHRVKTELPDGEPVILRRTKNGVQILFPERPRRHGIDVRTGSQPSKLGVTS